MALFAVLQGDSSRLPITKKDGYAYYTTDDNKFYIDSYLTESFIGDGETTEFISVNKFSSLGTVKIDNVLIDSEEYSYDTDTSKITFNTAPQNGEKIVISDSELIRRCINESIELDNTPIQGSENPITSNAVYEALQNISGGSSIQLITWEDDE